jgi:hypothetical protein
MFCPWRSQDLTDLLAAKKTLKVYETFRVFCCAERIANPLYHSLLKVR